MELTGLQNPMVKAAAELKQLLADAEALEIRLLAVTDKALQ